MRRRPCAGLCTESGFAAAYAAHRPRLLAKAMSVVADRQHAEDAVQDAFLRAWSKCSSFNPDGPPLAAWAYRRSVRRRNRGLRAVSG